MATIDKAANSANEFIDKVASATNQATEASAKKCRAAIDGGYKQAIGWLYVSGDSK